MRYVLGFTSVTLAETKTEKKTFIAEVSSPVGLTQALPRLHAGAVHAAGMRDALIAVLALPAVQTTATQNQAVSGIRRSPSNFTAVGFGNPCGI